MNFFTKTLIILFSIFFCFNSFSQLSGNQSRILSEEDRKIEERLQNANTKEIREYIGEVLDLKVPTNHKLDKKYGEYDEYSKASEVMGKEKYPEFYGRTGDDLLNAIKANPIEYRYLIFDTRRLREMYVDKIEK